QKPRPVHGPAPQTGPIPARRPLVRIKRLAHLRVDAVGADQHVAARGPPMRAGAIEEIGGDAAIVLGIGAQAMAGVNAALAETRARGLQDDALQMSPMNRELRHVIAGIGSARLAPDLLAETVGVEQLERADCDLVEPIEQTEFSQLLDRMRQRIDADAELADRFGLLEDLAIKTASMQHQRGCKPANAATDNDRLHECRSTPHTLPVPNQGRGRRFSETGFAR